MRKGSPTSNPPCLNPHDNEAAITGVTMSTPRELKNPITVYTKPNSSDVTNDAMKDLIAGPKPQPKTVTERAKDS
jgi:hypothetical protein